MPKDVVTYMQNDAFKWGYGSHDGEERWLRPRRRPVPYGVRSNTETGYPCHASFLSEIALPDRRPSPRHHEED